MQAKPIAFAKSSLWVKNSNSKKHVKIYSKSDLELLCAKRRLKNIKYSRNESILKIGHHASKAYSLCKIVTLGQKFKFQKNMSKSILQVTYSCSVQKTAWKTPNIREMRAF